MKSINKNNIDIDMYTFKDDNYFKNINNNMLKIALLERLEDEKEELCKNLI